MPHAEPQPEKGEEKAEHLPELETAVKAEAQPEGTPPAGGAFQMIQGKKRVQKMMQLNASVSRPAPATLPEWNLEIDESYFDPRSDTETPIDLPEKPALPSALEYAFELLSSDPQRAMALYQTVEAIAAERNVYVPDKQRAGIYISLRPPRDTLRPGQYVEAMVQVVTREGERLEQGWIRVVARGPIQLRRAGRSMRQSNVPVRDGYARFEVCSQGAGTGILIIADPEQGDNTMFTLNCVAS